MIRVLLSIPVFVAVLLLSACEQTAEPGSITQASNAEEQIEDSQPSPNIIFILVDDMGFADVGFNGSEIATPNLDQLASQGMRLDRNYVYPICSPTRAALMTGHDALAYGIDGPMYDQRALPLDLKIMPQYFKDMGYQTYMVGKWHLGIGDRDYWPSSRGFDYFYGHLGGWVDFYTHVYTDALDWQRNGESVREQGHTTDLLTTDAIRLIEQHEPEAPFFMYLSYNAPHSPLQFTPEKSGLNDHIEFGDRWVYAEMVTHMDAAIGELVNTLGSEGLLQNTLIVFSSDNGGSLSLGASNGDLRYGKGSTFEGGIRVPGLIYWPGQIDPGQVMQQPIAVYDWLPTLIEASGGDTRELIDPYGQSMWGAIAEQRQIDRAISTIGVRNSLAVFDWPWKLVRSNRDDIYGDFLYNLEDDPVEQNELSGEYPQKLQQLVVVLDDLPEVESRANPPGSPSPEDLFRNADNTGWNYEVRIQEAAQPKAEAAL